MYTNGNGINTITHTQLTSPTLSLRSPSGIQLPTSVEPQLFLRGVDVQKVMRDHRTNKYLHYKIPTTKIVIPMIDVNSGYTSNNINGANPNILLFTIPSKGEIKQITTNCNSYACFDSTGKEISGGKCNWCGDTFETARLGIPLQIVEYEGEHNHPLPVQLRNKNIGQIMIIYYESCSCCFECALAELKMRKLRSPSTVYYTNAERNLRYMFHLLHPDEDLHEAHDYLLHKNCGGSLSSEEFHSRHHIYSQVPNVIWAPVKGIYDVKSVRV